MRVSIAPSRNRQKHLRERKKGQQHTHRRRAKTLAQGPQRRGHTHPRHRAMQAHLPNDQVHQRTGQGVVQTALAFFGFFVQRQQSLGLRLRQALDLLERTVHYIGAGLRLV